MSIYIYQTSIKVDVTGYRSQKANKFKFPKLLQLTLIRLKYTGFKCMLLFLFHLTETCMYISYTRNHYIPLFVLLDKVFILSKVDIISSLSKLSFLTHNFCYRLRKYTLKY